MGFFKKNWDKPGPGVPKNAPKKTGFSRFFEIFGRDFSNLVKLNLILAGILLPATVLFGLSLLFYFIANFVLAFVLAGVALVACIPLGPALTAFYHALCEMLRDNPGFLGHNFKRIFKDNFRHMCLPGMLFGAMVGSMIFAFFYRSVAVVEISPIITSIYFFVSVLIAMIYPYFFTGAAYVDLRAGRTLQNAFLLAMANLPRSFVGAVLGTGLIVVQFLLFPYLTIITPLIGLSIPGLLNMMWIWPRIDSTFKIDETLRKRHDEQYRVLDLDNNE